MGDAESNQDASKYTPYEQWVRRLYMTNLFNPVKLGLKNIEELHKAIGNPMDNVRFALITIHALAETQSFLTLFSFLAQNTNHSHRGY
jgi:hypothetical protein